MSESISPDQYRDLDAIACKVARILARENVHYLLVGGYATTLVAGNRMTSEFRDVDFLVDTFPAHVRRLLTQYPGFEIESNNLLYKVAGKSIKVNTFDRDTFKMPDLDNVYSKTYMPHHKPDRRFSVALRVLHPTMIFMANLRCWMHIYDSERPQSQRKCEADEKNMMTLLKWAISCGFKIDLGGYIDKPKGEFYEPLAKLYSHAPDLRQLLDEGLKPEDLVIIRRS